MYSLNVAMTCDQATVWKRWGVPWEKMKFRTCNEVVKVGREADEKWDVVKSEKKGSRDIGQGRSDRERGGNVHPARTLEIHNEKRNQTRSQRLMSISSTLSILI
jgi:hypothetical protein